MRRDGPASACRAVSARYNAVVAPDPDGTAHLSQGRPRASEFVFARLRYDSGDWDYNPKVAANVLNSVVEYTTIPVYPEEVVITAVTRNCWRFRSCS